MKFTTMIAALAAATLATVTLVASAAAVPSARTQAFLADVNPNIDYLDKASRIARDQAASPKLRAFAEGVAQEQMGSAMALVAWQQAGAIHGAVGALAVTDGVVVPVVGVPTAPADEVVTGRSVAIDAPAASELQPASQPDLDRLKALKGGAFDSRYVATQTDALRHLQTLYTNYIESGDDLALRDFALGELPKIRVRLEALRAI